MVIARSRMTTEEIVRLNPTALDARLRQAGLYTMTQWNAFFTNPPLCITAARLREGFEIIDRALDATDAEVS